jgi:acylphosphatase
MTDEPAQRLRATVTGQVQGVGYRWFVHREAKRLGLTGWVANRQDGGVDVVAEGRHDALEELTRVLKEGAPGSVVLDVAINLEPARSGLSGFEIRSGGHRGD